MSKTNTFYTVPTIAALKALTTRPSVVEVTDTIPGIFNWSNSACSAADDVDQVSPTSGPAGCFIRMRETGRVEIDFSKAISGAATPTNEALYMTGTMTGTTTDFSWAYQQIVFAEYLDQTGSSAGATINGLYVNHAAYTGYGARNGILGVYSHNASTGGASDRAFYTAIFAETAVNHNDGGGAGTERGDFFGQAGIVSVAPGVTHLHGVIGAEYDISLPATTSTLEKMILQLVLVNSDAVKGSNVDAGIVLTGDSTALVGLDFGIAIGKPNDIWPIDATTGTIIGTYATSNVRQAKYGINFAGVTFDTAFLKSDFFTVNNNGVTIIDTSTLAEAFGLEVIGDGTNGATIALADAGAGKNKYLRNLNSHLQIIDNAHAVVLFDLDDSGTANFINAVNITNNTFPQLSIRSTATDGPTIDLLDTTNTKHKFIRNVNSVLQVVNDAHSTVLFTVDDSGNIVATAGITGTTGTFSNAVVITDNAFPQLSIRSTNSDGPTLDLFDSTASKHKFIRSLNSVLQVINDAHNTVIWSLDDLGAMTVGSYIEGTEQTAPAAPAANGYRIFAQDNGAGKTQLMVIFSSGAAQQLAIQP